MNSRSPISDGTPRVVGYEVRTENGYIRKVRNREEAVLVQMHDPRYRAIAIYADGSESTIY